MSDIDRETSTALPRLPALDTLRGLASLAVVITHVAFWAGYYDAGLLGAVAQRLEVGVAIFFVLSGYLLSYPRFAAARCGVPAERLATYASKRVLRVLPVYWVTVVLAMVLVDLNQDRDWQTWLDNLLMIQLYRDTIFPEGLSQMWSLATEAAFYLVLPALTMALTCRRFSRRSAQLILLTLMAAASIVWAGLAAGPFADLGSWTTLALPSYLCWFAAGMAIAVVHVELRLGDGTWWPVVWCRAAAETPGACWLVAAALVVVQSTPLGGAAGLFARTSSESVLRAVLYLVVAVAVMLPAVFGAADTPHGRVMAWAPLRHLGRISYSLFCCHVIVLAVLFQSTSWVIFDENVVLVFVVVLAISLAVAEILYRAVERPFLRRKPKGPAATRTDPTPSQASN
ncbi:acyltransferase family protein [Aeromicrobium sp. CF3.5]|uniref:acyltransferase family protein n=1 Tax=Aeromicrobium sp. CF3.5 TaxID=3373078 RepID=UPI003EE5306D